jgi:hypothetical protein
VADLEADLRLSHFAGGSVSVARVDLRQAGALNGSGGGKAQSDYAAMQGRKPCRPVVWPSQPAIELALKHLDKESFELSTPEAVPRCPTCGGDVFLNVRLDDGFVEVPYQPQAQRLRNWLAGAIRRRLLLIEIGAGFNTPTVVRWQLENLAQTVPGARFVRINRDDADTDSLTADRSSVIAGEAIAALATACI